VTPKISIVIPTYNRAHVLGRAIESVFAQTVSDFEILVADDGSTDATAALLESFPERVLHLRQSNRGPAAARNLGMAAARGEYIAFLDSDDAYFPRNLEAHLEVFDRNPGAGLVYAGSEIVDAGGAFVKELRPRPGNRGRVLPQLLFFNFIMPSSVVMRRACYEYAGPMNEELHFAEDWLYWLRIAGRFSFDYVDAPLVRFQRTPGSASRRPLPDLVTMNMHMFDLAFADPDLGPQIAPHRNLTLSRAYLGYARSALEAVDLGLARGLVVRAMRHRPADPETLILFVKTLVPKGLLRRARRMVRGGT
jgi:glycosyltransferase involved in cell wall biosynthesis